MNLLNELALDCLDAISLVPGADEPNIQRVLSERWVAARLGDESGERCSQRGF